MRLWTLHPRYLDTKGLLAVWREALLAQAVLTGKTRGYKNHPQLFRFNQQINSITCINAYLQGLYEESVRRGYNFDKNKFAFSTVVEVIIETEGQVLYEWQHLLDKLSKRDLILHERFSAIICPDPHPLFKLVPGPIQSWERVTTKTLTSSRS